MHGWAVVRTGHPLESVTLALPAPSGTQVLVEVTHCGVCHSDLYFQDGFYEMGGGKRLSLADRGVPLPLIPGHEPVGRVVAVGPDATGVQVGDERLIYPWAGCGDCGRCRAGTDHLCARPRSVGAFRDGGYASHILVDRAEHLVDFGAVDPAWAATFACSGLTSYSAVKKLSHLDDEDPILVIGAGGLGLAGIGILHALGRKRIIVADIDPAKRAAALEAGAHHVVDGRAPGILDDIRVAAQGRPIFGIVDFVASADTARIGIDALGKGGAYVAVGVYGGEIPLPLASLPLRAITLQGSYTGSLQELKELVALAQGGRLKPIPVERVPHAKPNEALDRLRAGKVTGRLVLSVACACPP